VSVLSLIQCSERFVGKKAPKPLNAVMNDPVTLETMLINANIAGDSDTAGELLTKIQEQKEQTNLDGESE